MPVGFCIIIYLFLSAFDEYKMCLLDAAQRCEEASRYACPFMGAFQVKWGYQICGQNIGDWYRTIGCKVGQFV